MQSCLTDVLAQEIVNRTMAILPYNINVMDDHGRIIGSGDKERISTLHEVAAKVIDRKMIIEIYKEDLQQWSGVKEGINLPILFQDQVVGVVGITGSPNEVRGYGKLVKMTAEMIMEHSFLQKQLQLDKRITEEVIYQIINGKYLDEALIYEKAKAINIELHEPRVAVVIKHTLNHSNMLLKLEHTLVELADKNDLIATTYTGEFVVLKKVTVVCDNWDKNQTIQTLRIWLARLSKVDPSIKISMGSYYSSIELIYKSFYEARETSKVGEILEPKEQLLLFEDFSLYVLLNELTKSIEKNPLFDLLETFKQHDEMGELQKTLQYYIYENGKVNQTANKLFIHRNSLQYRLEKIRELTGRDPKNFKDLFELYMSVVIDKLIHSRPN